MIENLSSRNKLRCLLGIIGFLFFLQGLAISEKVPELTTPPPLSVSAQITPVSCPAASDGSIFLQVSGGNPPYYYNWSNGEASKDLDELSQGNYLLTITDNVGHTLIRNYEVLYVHDGSTDTDGDGIVDRCDLDDDNDGILDTTEGCVEFCSQEEILNGSFEDGPYPGTYIQTGQENIYGWETTSTDDLIEIWHSGFNGVIAQEGDYFAELNATENAALYQSICVAGGSEISWSVWHRGRAGTDHAVVKIGPDVNNATVYADMITGTTNWQNYSGTYTVPEGQNTTVLIFEAISTHNGNLSIGNFIDNVTIETLYDSSCLDLDDDGIPNARDLDSDGDGCYDVDESGGLDNDGDGILDGSSVDDQGLVIGSSGAYNGLSGDEYEALGIEYNSVFGEQAFISEGMNGFEVDLSAQTATDYVSGSPVYAIAGNANSGLSYQWYSGHPDYGGNQLQDDGFYSGTASPEITINDDTSLLGEQFCIEVKHDENLCLQEIICTMFFLPVEMLSFDARIENGDVRCVWVTATELNNDYFTIERSTDYVEWEAVGTVSGAGTSLTQQAYSFLDENPVFGTSYYRVRQTDYNGSSSASWIKAVNLMEDEEAVIYPNPNTGAFSLDRNLENYKLVIVDVKGRSVPFEFIPPNSVSMDAPEGLYFLMAITPEDKVAFRERCVVRR